MPGKVLFGMSQSFLGSCMHKVIDRRFEGVKNKVLWAATFSALLMGFWCCQPAQNVATSPNATLPIRTVAQGVTFFALADWGVYGQFHQQQVADQMENYAIGLKPAFVLMAGDNFYTQGVSSLADSHWQLSFENVYKGAHLPASFYIALGNHDYQGTASVELQYGQQHPRWVLPARYYTKVINLNNKPLIRLIVLDSNPFIQAYQQNPGAYPGILQNTQAQLHWADSVLSTATEPWKIVMAHHPLYSVGADHGNQAELISQLGPLLQKYQVQLYISGHSHSLQHLPRVGPTDFVVSGGGGAPLDVLAADSTRATFARASGGFAIFSANSDSLRMSFIDNLGQPIYSWGRSKQ